jgi:hypothetical protein
MRGRGMKSVAKVLAALSPEEQKKIIDAAARKVAAQALAPGTADQQMRAWYDHHYAVAVQVRRDVNDGKCKLIAPNGVEFRASTTESVGFDDRNPILRWILGGTERTMTKQSGGLRSVASCTEFKCLVRYMNAAQITGQGITKDSTGDAVRLALGGEGYTIAREISGRNHTSKDACDNCKQWLAEIGWKWAPGWP